MVLRNTKLPTFASTNCFTSNIWVRNSSFRRGPCGLHKRLFALAMTPGLQQPTIDCVLLLGSSVRLQQLTIGAMDPYPTFRFEHARSLLPCPQCGRPCVSSSVTIFNSYFEDHWKGYFWTFTHDTAPKWCIRRDAAQPSWPSNWRSVRFVVSIGGVELEATADTSKLTRRSC